MNRKSRNIPKKSNISQGKAKAGSLGRLPTPNTMAQLGDIRKDIKKHRLAIAKGEEIPVEYYGEVVGWFVPPDSVDLEGEIVEEVSMVDFRRDLTAYWEKLHSGKADAILVVRGKRKTPAIAFISVELYQALGASDDLP